MVHYLESLKGFHDPNKYIFHADLDEIVFNNIKIKDVFHDLERGICDYAVGEWSDRLSLDGSLNELALGNGVGKYYSCDFENIII
jgi:hypothetical protein